MKVTIVIAAFNAARFLGETLQSVRRQSHDDWECLVVDDGSTDDTAVIAATAAAMDVRIRVVAKVNGGASASRNVGAQMASGDALLFLDADDLLHSTALRRLSDHLLARPDAVGAFGTMLRIDERGVLEPRQKPVSQHLLRGDIEAVVRHSGTFSNGAQLLVRKDAFERAGGYSTRLRLSEDYEFWARLACSGDISYIGPAEEVMYLRVHAASISGGLSRVWTNHQSVLDMLSANTALAAKFSKDLWRSILRHTKGNYLFECGRQAFRSRNRLVGLGYMVRSLCIRPTKRSIALTGLAASSIVAGRTLHQRLR